MAYEVFSTFTRCAAIHGSHSNVPGAVACYNTIVTNIEGKIPSWKHTGKHVHVVGAVDRQGRQRALTDREISQLTNLGLPPEAFLIEKETITTFNNIAEMFHEASRLMPISNISLEGLFDYEARNKHFWGTTAGMGQAFVFAQQIVFTVELALKALLEASGKLLTVPPNTWQTHDLVELFNLLDTEEQRTLEQRWKSLPSSHNQSHKNLFDLLSATKNHYMDWRYIPTLTSTELSLDVTAMLGASGLILGLAMDTFRENSPVSVNVEVTSQAPASPDRPDATKVLKRVMVKGVIQSVNIPEGFEPHSQVDVVVQLEAYYDGMTNKESIESVTARFRKSQVESYYGIVGENVCLVGWSTESDPHILDSASHNGTLNRGASYTFEHRTLRGTVFDLKKREKEGEQTAEFTLILDDSTYYTKVDCHFLTDEEREQIVDVRLGAEITIQGQSTLLNGKPVSLFAPRIVN